MLTKRIVLLSCLFALSGSAAYAGLNDGIRPGPSPAAWLSPAMPKAPAYALSGSSKPARREQHSTGWQRQTRQIGNKITVDTFSR